MILKQDLYTEEDIRNGHINSSKEEVLDKLCQCSLAMFARKAELVNIEVKNEEGEFVGLNDHTINKILEDESLLNVMKILIRDLNMYRSYYEKHELNKL